jgi:hypothetical protein
LKKEGIPLICILKVHLKMNNNKEYSQNNDISIDIKQGKEIEPLAK